MRRILPILFLLFLPLPLFAQTEISALHQRTSGIYIFETARAYNVPGTDYGIASKISYGRNISLYGFSIRHQISSWSIGYRLLLTDGGENIQSFRDEDFITYAYMDRRGPRVDLLKGRFIDSPDSWTGVIDGINDEGHVRLRERQQAIDAFYALSESWSLGMRFNYIKNKYQLKEHVAVIETRIQPLYAGVRFVSNMYELQGGFQYKKNLKPYAIQFSFLPGYGLINARDFHEHRALILRLEGMKGFSLYATLGLSYSFKSFTVHANAFAHRLYTRAQRTRIQGIETMGANVPSQGADLNLKENGYEFGLTYHL